MKNIYFLASIICLTLSPLAFAAGSDINQDGIVDQIDLTALAGHWLDSNTAIPENIDQLGLVDFADFSTLSGSWLMQAPDSSEMAYIPGGSFMAVDSNSLPLHTVTIAPFYMGRFEVTTQQYCDFLNWAHDNGWVTLKQTSAAKWVEQVGTGIPYCQIMAGSLDPDGISFASRYTLYYIQNHDSNHPMIRLSWYGAVAYCNWRSLQEGRPQCYDLTTWQCDFTKHGYRLPTEAEWEYAARGGLEQQRFPWGDTISQTQANFYSEWTLHPHRPVYDFDQSPTEGFHPIWNPAPPRTSPVGFFDGQLKYKADFNWAAADLSYQTTAGANGYDLYDMSGNVAEFCNDWVSSSADPNTYYMPPDNPIGPETGSSRVVRGGNWAASAPNCQLNARSSCVPSEFGGNTYNGFRMALEF